MAMRTNTLYRHFGSQPTHLLGFTAVYNEIGGVFSDETVDASDGGTADVVMPSASGDRQYYGTTGKVFDFIRFSFSTNPVGGTRTWEYWNGSAWTAITPTVFLGSLNLTGAADTQFKIALPADWAQTAVNGTSAYWLRSTVGTAYTTAGVGSVIVPGNVLDFGTITLDVAETASRTIRAVLVRLIWSYVPDSGLPRHVRVAATVGAGARTYVLDDATDIGSSSSSSTGHFVDVTFDATAYVATNFGAGATQTMKLEASWCYGMSTSANLSTLGITCAAAEVIITYEYDDASLTTATKTVFIPIESHTGSLTTSLAEIGTNQVPALDTFCPEASKSFKEIAFVLRGAVGWNATGLVTTNNIALALDSEAEAAMPPAAPGRGGLNHIIYHWIRSDMSTASVHALKARSTNVSYTPQPFLGGYIAVTYTYDAAASTTILNSIRIPLPAPDHHVYPFNAVAERDVNYVDVWVEEPGAVTLRQSALMQTHTTFINNRTVTMNCKIGAQASYRTMTGTIGQCFDYTTSFIRFDSGGSLGAGLTLARGKNRIAWHHYYNSSDATEHDTISAFSGILFLNYTSGKASAGVGAHNHTTEWFVCGAPGGNVNYLMTSAIAPVIADAEYFVNSVGLDVRLIGPGDGTSLVKAQVLAGEGEGAGWKNLLMRIIRRGLTAYMGTVETFVDVSGHFRRSTADADAERLVLENARKYAVVGPTSLVSNLNSPFVTMLVTYHGVTKTVTGTVVDGEGNPQAGATVTLRRTDTGEKLGAATTNGSGVYVITCFDDTVAVFTETRISGALLGRSDDGYAS